MDDFSYWRKQTDKPLFPEVEWSKPEQRALSGKLGIVGGNKLGFASVAESYTTALKTGVGAAKIILPDALNKSIPNIPDVIYSETTISGGLAKNASKDLAALGEWADGMLFIGDTGRNSETAILYEQFLRQYEYQVTITRDAIDLMRPNSNLLVERPNTVLIMSFAQTQKLFQSLYYPKVLTFSMQLMRLVEALHKFTITYPVTLSVFHQDMMLVANNGQVTSTPYNPMRIWRGETATKAATYWLWNPKKPLESITSSLLN